MKKKLFILLVPLLAATVLLTPAGCAREDDRPDFGGYTPGVIYVDYVYGYETLGELAEAADLIVAGTIGPTAEVVPDEATKDKEDPRSRMWQTRSAFKVEKSVKGDCPEEIIISQVGAVCWAQEDGNPVFQPGERCFLFLKQNEDSTCRLVHPDGRFRIEDDKVSSLNFILPTGEARPPMDLRFWRVDTNDFISRITEALEKNSPSVEHTTLTPEEILVGLPVYPGSVPAETAATSNETGRYRTASVKYEVEADIDSLIDWYEEYFTTAGFHFHYGSTTKKSYREIISRKMNYWLPAQPAMSVEVTARPKDDPSSTVYELLVSEDVLAARPYNENLIPSDVEQIDIEYRDCKPVTVTGNKDIEALAGLVNSLPVDPEYARFGPLPEPDIIEFSLAFHSASQGTITLFERNNQIYIEGHPVLWDTHALLMGKVREIGIIEETP